MILEIIALLISYSGVFIGKYLSKVAKEEVEYGKRNLAILHNLIFISILIYLFLFNESSLNTKAFIAFAIIITMLVTKNLYAVLGLIFGVNPTFLMSSLIFIYGFPTGSLTKDNYFKIFKKTWFYVLLGLIFLIVKNTI